MKEIVLKLELQDDREKKKAMKTVASHSGIDSISMNMNQKKLSVTGVADPISIVTKLRKYWPTTDIIFVGPAKAPEKPTEKKQEAVKKEGDGTQGKKEEQYDHVMEMMLRAYNAYNPQLPTYHYVQPMEENPSACTIM